ncbi:MAG: glycosyltransferase family 4 protein [Bacteroidota bacterium]|nr:glycosyltransferase family 4 protein [Bacteroidota bacterium]
MKLSYVTTYDSSDIHAWSGCVVGILKTLQNSGFQTEQIDNLKERCIFMLKIKKAYYAKILSKTYLCDRDPFLLKNYAAQVDSALEHLNGDVVFSPGTIPIAYLQTRKPIVFWTDASFAGMIDFYPDFSNLCAETIKNGNKMEQLALSKCRLAIYSSEWAANTAIQNYDVDPAKVKVVPLGGNANENRNLHQINTIIKNKDFDTCRLLFVGVDWSRKGGDLAIKVAELLTKRGIKTELHIVGCKPPYKVPNYVKLYPFLSKNTEEGRNTMDKLMSGSHFFILPSKAECYGSVFGEASSFGLPSLATKVGGIPSAIKDGKNGQTFSLDEGPEKYCDYIERLMSSKQDYNELALSSFSEYTKRMSWASSGKKVYELIKEFCF